MGRELFGTDGVRGLAGEYPLNSDGCKRVGMAVGTYFAQPGQSILIACDTRESSQQIVRDLTGGLNATGVNVVSAGVMTTPGLAYLTDMHDEFVAGVMVTASHNPYQYNGIKVFDGAGDKLSDETESKLNDLIENGVAERGQGNQQVDAGLGKEYEDFLVNTAQGLDLARMKIAVDCANGSASSFAASLFQRLGADVTVMFNQPNGRNINDGCGATNITELKKTVLDNGLDLGIALDGDADRLIMVDHKGREVKGDYLLYILAVVRGVDGVVATIMSNQGFELALQKRNIKLLRTSVGDRYVLEGLEQTGYKLGGEESGHIIFPSVLKTGDGLLAAVQMLRAISTSGRSLADWCDEVELLPQALVNVPVRDFKLLEKPTVVDFINQQAKQLKDGRLLIRPSGTEPLVRIMVEAPNAQAMANNIAAGLQQLLTEQETPK